MARIDSDGKLSIGKERGEKFGLIPGCKICFSPKKVISDALGGSVYRLGNLDKRPSGEFILAEEFPIVDKNYRFLIPSTLRKMYADEIDILENGDGNLYLNFQRYKSDVEWARNTLLESMTDDRK